MSLLHEDHAPDPESETLLARDRTEVFPMVAPGALPQVAGRESFWGRLIDGRRAPFLQLIAYYALVVAALAALIVLFPSVRRAFLAPVVLPAVAGIEGAAGQGAAGAVVEGTLDFRETMDRALTTLLVIAGALALVVPVARVYMMTKRFRFDPSLVRSVIILPIVVAGIALVVKNSLALAFSLAGIVAAVRFRNTLKDPRDAVYIFLVIGIGLSAGVQALDVALVMSFAFNMVVLSLWRYNIGSIYGGRFGRTGILSVGASSLLVAQTPEQQRLVRGRHLNGEDEMRIDGILLVHSFQPDLARSTVQEAFSDLAKDWRLTEIADRGAGMATLEYLVSLKREASPAELVSALDERWSSQVAAAEYVPFRVRRRGRKRKERRG